MIDLSACSRSRSSRTSPTITMALQVWTDGEDWVVAESAEDAVAVMMEHIGADDPSEITEARKWKALANDKTLRVTVDDDPAEHHIKTCAEWAAEGRGHLASVNL